jgi:hypothetical protein
MASPAVSPTPAPTPTPVPLALAQSAARSTFVGLLWGGILLVILAFWLGLKYAEESSRFSAWIIGAVALVALGLAGWHAFVLWLQKAPPDQRIAALTHQRRVTATALLAGGALLVVMALVIGFGPRPGGTGITFLRGNFGESIGLFLFALVTIVAGRLLLNPPAEEMAPVNLEPVRNLFPLIRTALLLTGVILVIVFAVLAFYYKVGLGYFPELAGLLLFSMLCLAVGLWMTSINIPDPFTTRIFVLVFGGLTGLILFVMTLARAIAWREQVFLSGISTWQGEESWRLWLFVYLQMIALALMFGSLLLGRADIRANAVLRRVLFGYSTILNGLLLLEMLIILNIVFYALVPYNFDWTSTRGLHALAQSTKNLLHELKQPTEVVVLMSPGSAGYTEVRNFMENLQAESNKLNVEYISPDRDSQEYNLLAKKFPKLLPSTGLIKKGDETGRGILIVYGPMPKDEKHKVPYAFVPERKIYEESPGMPHAGGKVTRTFKGEIEVTKELNFLVHGQEKRKVYFLQGDDEIDITNTEAVRRTDPPRAEMSALGASMLVERLKKDNYEVQGVTFSKDFANEKKKDNILLIGEGSPDKKTEIDAKDTYAVVIAGPSSPIPAEGLAILEKYVDKGGRLMVLLDITLTKDLKGFRDSGIETMLRKYGIESADEFALAAMLGTRKLVDPYKILALTPENSENALAKQFMDRGVNFRTVRVIRPGGAPGGRYKAETVFASIPWDPRLADKLPAVVAGKKVSAMLDPLGYFDELEQNGQLTKDIRQALPVVVGVSEEDRPRMVVFGDTEFISNYAMVTGDREDNYALFVSSLEWIGERKGLIGPQPKSTSDYKLQAPVAIDYSRIHLVPMWLMFLTIVCLGTGIWLVRRR